MVDRDERDEQAHRRERRLDQERPGHVRAIRENGTSLTKR
jgi:hypothetical protein